MAIVGGFDVHRAQITFDCLDAYSGEVRPGEVRPATRATLCEWLVSSTPTRRPSPSRGLVCVPCCGGGSGQVDHRVGPIV